MKKLIGIVAVGCMLSLTGWASAADIGASGSTEMGSSGSAGGAAAAAEKATPAAKDDGAAAAAEKTAPAAKDDGAAAAAEKAAPAAKVAANTRTIKGELLKIDGENYVVKDATGKEVKLHVSAETKKDGDVKVGDKIEAQADASGHATSIKTAKSAH